MVDETSYHVTSGHVTCHVTCGQFQSGKLFVNKTSLHKVPHKVSSHKIPYHDRSQKSTFYYLYVSLFYNKIKMNKDIA
jgi:hypothetical protein